MHTFVATHDKTEKATGVWTCVKTSFVSSVFETATNVRKASADSVLRWVASMDWSRPMAPQTAEQLAAAAAAGTLLLVDLPQDLAPRPE